MSSDLTGTVIVIFDPASVTFAGVTISNSGTAQWTITGGIIPGLESFITKFENRNINTDRPGSPSTIFENKGKHRALAGVEKANLTYKGEFSAITNETNSHYQGVICVE